MAELVVPATFNLISLADIDDSLSCSAVYLLFRGDDVVYVGQSCDVLRRLGEHISDRTKRFDAVATIRCQASNRVWLEQLYIEHFKPKYNGMTALEVRQSRRHRRRLTP